jgi:hypothetical protein
MEGTVLLSKGASETGSAGDTLGEASSVIPGGVTGEPKTGMNSSFGSVTVSIRSAKHKRQDLTHKIIFMENVNLCLHFSDKK